MNLFLTFAKIGTFTIGGGYAMIPLMEEELVRKSRSLTAEEFLDVLALSQAMPGVFAVNMAAVVGNRLKGLKGSVSAICGTVLAPIAIILLVAILYRRLSDNPHVEHAFMAVRPVVVALIAAPVVRLAKSAKIGWSTCWIPVAAVVLIALLGVSPVWVIVGVMALAVVYFLGRKKTNINQQIHK
ncbi:MAG: chromate transporter [Bacteroidales bacterium]|nr:chromate transporter [Bacteroidales bacterium]